MKKLIIVVASLAVLWLLAPLIPFILVLVSTVAFIVFFARMLMPL